MCAGCVAAHEAGRAAIGKYYSNTTGGDWKCPTGPTAMLQTVRGRLRGLWGLLGFLEVMSGLSGSVVEEGE